MDFCFKSPKDKYQNACNEYLQAFCQKHNFDRSDACWLFVGDIVKIGDFFIKLRDIIIDLECNVPEEEFLKWYNYSVENEQPLTYMTWISQGNPNYNPPCESRVKEAREEFEKYLDEYINENGQNT